MKFLKFISFLLLIQISNEKIISTQYKAKQRRTRILYKLYKIFKNPEARKLMGVMDLIKYFAIAVILMIAGIIVVPFVIKLIGLIISLIADTIKDYQKTVNVPSLNQIPQIEDIKFQKEEQIYQEKYSDMVQEIKELKEEIQQKFETIGLTEQKINELSENVGQLSTNTEELADDLDSIKKKEEKEEQEKQALENDFNELDNIIKERIEQKRQEKIKENMINNQR